MESDAAAAPPMVPIVSDTTAFADALPGGGGSFDVETSAPRRAAATQHHGSQNHASHPDPPGHWARVQPTPGTPDGCPSVTGDDDEEQWRLRADRPQRGHAGQRHAGQLHASQLHEHRSGQERVRQQLAEVAHARIATVRERGAASGPTKVRLRPPPPVYRGQRPTTNCWEPGIGKGRSAATAANITKLNEAVAVCPQAGCAAILCVNAMRRAMRRQTGSAVGCTARGCVKRFDVARHIHRQSQRIEGVVEGLHTLVQPLGDAAQYLSAALPPAAAADALHAAFDAIAAELPNARSIFLTAPSSPPP